MNRYIEEKKNTTSAEQIKYCWLKVVHSLHIINEVLVRTFNKHISSKVTE